MWSECESAHAEWVFPPCGLWGLSLQSALIFSEEASSSKWKVSIEFVYLLFFSVLSFSSSLSLPVPSLFISIHPSPPLLHLSPLRPPDVSSCLSLASSLYLPPCSVFISPLLSFYSPRSLSLPPSLSQRCCDSCLCPLRPEQVEKNKTIKFASQR